MTAVSIDASRLRRSAGMTRGACGRAPSPSALPRKKLWSKSDCGIAHSAKGGESDFIGGALAACIKLGAIMSRFAVAFLPLASLLLLSSAYAQPPARATGQQTHRGTMDDQKACQNDAVKLCRKALGDDFAVLHCFQSQRARLSVACRQVLEKYGQ
jgi:hypothetical protein